MEPLVVAAVVGAMLYFTTVPMAYGLGRRSGNAKRKGTVLWVGLRASTKTPFLKWAKPVKGKLQWDAAGDNEDGASIDIEPGMVWSNGDTKVGIVDLDRQQLVEYEGTCRNDSDLVVVQKDGRCIDIKLEDRQDWLDNPQTERILSNWWRRITGSFMATVRKDTRAQQLGQAYSGFWAQLLKFTPLFLLVLVILAVILIAMVGTMMVKL